MTAEKKRLRELDFLRGIAIVLVLFRHQFVSDFTQKAGWIGVDLFFVLSGFLVSGLLFKEYQRFGNIRPGLFLIRRGFKIYPIYFLFYVLYLGPIVIKRKFDLGGFLSDMFFVQNYVRGWGYAYAPSWSLAVEEHFYFGFAMLMLVGISANMFNVAEEKAKSTISAFELLTVAVMVLCLFLRIFSNLHFPEYGARLITMTHLRIDSLLAGVLISYWYHFRHAAFVRFINANKKILLAVVVILVSFTPLLEYTESFFAKTIGFTMLYTAFGIVLAWFLADPKINNRLDAMLTPRVVGAVSKIGFASYSIYIIHTFVNYVFALGLQLGGLSVPSIVVFVATSAISIGCGLAMTAHVEKYFLSLRDRYYPARTN
jgi:peptidoglycan/LPS O-acetylase OafA/YrhL